jgi:hypothetical protein
MLRNPLFLWKMASVDTDWLLVLCTVTFRSPNILTRAQVNLVCTFFVFSYWLNVLNFLISNCDAVTQGCIGRQIVSRKTLFQRLQEKCSSVGRYGETAAPHV